MTTHVGIIGAYGSAGIAAAQALVEAPNIRLTLIDEGEPGGGLCILKGCMPSKEVLSAAAHRFQVRKDDRLTGQPPEVDADTVVATKNDHVAAFAEHRREAVHRLADQNDVDFIHGSATFVDDRTVAINNREFTFDYVVIATGSTINIPKLPGIAEVPYQTSDDVLDATTFPETGIVMGFGYVGLELVPYLVEVGGVDVTVIEHDDRPLDEADPAFGDELLELYRQEFDIDILTNTTERSVRTTDEDHIALTVNREGQTEVHEAEELYMFTGRRPAVDRLGLEHTELRPTDGWVEDTLQATADETVYVVGDVNDKEPILHVAKKQGKTAAKNILADLAGKKLTTYDPLTHHVVFSGCGIYPYARVGHSHASAEKSGIAHFVVSRTADSDGVFKTKDVPEGRAMLVVQEETGTVIGYQGMHYHADVMAKSMQIVIELALDVRDLPDRSFHPTTPEILDGLFREATNRLPERAP